MCRKSVTRISIAEDFSQFPAGRFREDGLYNGTTFREDTLVPALQKLDDSGLLEVSFDGVSGFGTSFLEEAFGGLIRRSRFTKAFLDEHLRITAEQGDLLDFVQLALSFIDAEEKRRSRKQ